MLICETPLAGGAWEQHGVDIAEDGGLPLIGSRPVKTGVAAFDQRFTVWEDGAPMRAGWLDAPARVAVTALFDSTPLSGSLWVRGGRMQYVAVAPKGVDGETLAKVLHTESVVGFAFERTVV
ncbi:MAG: hypothetical protein ABI782_07130 [Anaerolineaceae bacterium]